MGRTKMKNGREKKGTEGVELSNRKLVLLYLHILKFSIMYLDTYQHGDRNPYWDKTWRYFTTHTLSANGRKSSRHLSPSTDPNCDDTTGHYPIYYSPYPPYIWTAYILDLNYCKKIRNLNHSTKYSLKNIQSIYRIRSIWL